MRKLAVSTELDDLTFLAMFAAAHLREALAWRPADHAIQIALGDAALTQGGMDLVRLQKADVFTNRGRSRSIVAMVELKRLESFGLDIVSEDDVEAPRLGETTGRSATTAKKTLPANISSILFRFQKWPSGPL